MRYLRFISIAVLAVFLIVFGYSCRNSDLSSSASDKLTIVSELSQDEQDIQFMTALGLMQGHLLVAKELLDQGTPDQAEPHLGHPVNELYSEVETQLAKRNTPDFKEDLIQLYDIARYSPADIKVAETYKLSLQKINQAIKTLPTEKRQSPDFMLKVINEMLEVADIEYRAGIANGEIVEAIEYQDSRGFVITAQTFYQTIADQVSQTDPGAHSVISTSLTELQKAWPSVNGPSPIVMTPDKVSEYVSMIQSSSEAVYTSD